MTRTRVAWILASIVTLVVIVLAGVLSHSEQASASAAVNQVPTWTPLFVADYEARHGDIDTVLENELVNSSNAVCGDLVAGRTQPQVWQMLVDHGQSSDQAATVIELSIKYYCPEEGQAWPKS